MLDVTLLRFLFSPLLNNFNSWAVIFVTSRFSTHTDIISGRERSRKPEIKARWTRRGALLIYIYIYFSFFFFRLAQRAPAAVSLIFFSTRSRIESRRVSSNENPPFCAVPLRLRIEGVVASDPPLRVFNQILSLSHDYRKNNKPVI